MWIVTPLTVFSLKKQTQFLSFFGRQNTQSCRKPGFLKVPSRRRNSGLSVVWLFLLNASRGGGGGGGLRAPRWVRLHLLRRFLAVLHNNLLCCITFVTPASRHSMLGDELLNYRARGDTSESADGVGMPACGTDVSWAPETDAGWVYIIDSSLKLQHWWFDELRHMLLISCLALLIIGRQGALQAHNTVESLISLLQTKYTIFTRMIHSHTAKMGAW